MSEFFILKFDQALSATSRAFKEQIKELIQKIFTGQIQVNLDKGKDNADD